MPPKKRQWKRIHFLMVTDQYKELSAIAKKRHWNFTETMRRAAELLVQAEEGK